MTLENWSKLIPSRQVKRWISFLEWAWFTTDYLYEGEVGDEMDNSHVDALYQAEDDALKVEMMEAYIMEEGI